MARTQKFKIVVAATGNTQDELIEAARLETLRVCQDPTAFAAVMAAAQTTKSPSPSRAMLRLHYFVNGEAVVIEIPRDCAYITVPAQDDHKAAEVCINSRGIVIGPADDPDSDYHNVEFNSLDFLDT